MAGQLVRRSWIMIPATHVDALDQSWTLGADVVVIDLEDLVHDSRKHQARTNVRAGIERARLGGAEVFVRCDLELLYADLEASVWRGLQGIILPKVSTVEQIREAEETLAYFEAEHGVMQAGLIGEVNEYDEPRTVENSLEIHLALEDAKGNYAAEQLIGASPRIRSASLGRADLVMDLRPEPSGELHLMPFLMQRLILLANAAGVSPIGAWWQGNSRGLRASAADTLRSARLGLLAGFRGGVCVLPEQVTGLNEGFTPTSEDERWAERCLAAGAGAELDGVLLEAGAIECGRATLQWAEACRERDSFKAAAVRGCSR